VNRKLLIEELSAIAVNLAGGVPVRTNFTLELEAVQSHDEF
jgi:hypothetical protein